MNRIIINGCCGRMGRFLMDMIGETEGMQVVAGIDPFIPEGTDFGFPVYTSLDKAIEEADVVIDFSIASGVPSLLESVKKKGLGIVVATTGLDEDTRQLLREASKSVPVFFSANMSLGINLLKELIKKTAEVLGKDYDVEIIEKHHKMKKDAPSGTALALADALREVRDFQYVYGRKETEKARAEGELGIHAFRGGSIVGEHEVIFAGSNEVIEITHKAYSRELFARGAVRAAGYLKGKAPGFYSMEDMLSGEF
ncbi:MAG: 4-hydroxy-tetrahydrodipicolinate reductase [Spirochaetales bacterium]|nr:4-hydroxy-tetrahydrodipicolinate reductase [Spirochaetales bacterium]